MLASASHTAFQQNRLGIDFGRLLCCANNLQMTTAGISSTFGRWSCAGAVCGNERLRECLQSSRARKPGAHQLGQWLEWQRWATTSRGLHLCLITSRCEPPPLKGPGRAKVILHFRVEARTSNRIKTTRVARMQACCLPRHIACHSNLLCANAWPITSPGA